MLVILASIHDEAARWLSDRWSDREARVLTAPDLSAAGWRHPLGSPNEGFAVIGGRIYPTRRVNGVLTRLPCMPADELAEIVPADRAYVATEMTAFLRSWLCSLDCPVVNAPTATCLAGPGWGREQWTLAAAGLGGPVRPVCRSAAFGTVADTAFAPGGVTVTVAGGRCFGTACAALAQRAGRLAAAAGVSLLAVRFGRDAPDAEFWDADPWPDVTVPEVADAVVMHLEGKLC